MTTRKPSIVFFFKRKSFLWGLHGQVAALTVCFLLVVQGHRLVFRRLQDWIKKANVWSFLKRMMDGLQMKEESVKKRPVTSYFSHTERKCPNIRVSGLLIHFLTAGYWVFCTSTGSTPSPSSVCVSSPDSALQKGTLAKSRREYVRMARGSGLVAASSCLSADPPWAAPPWKQNFFI